MAFFVVNLGLSPGEYEDLTPRQKQFMVKAWEQKVVRDTDLINMAVNNAIGNALRSKNKRPIPLWRKNIQRGDREWRKDTFKIIQQMEEDQGKDWVKKIYRANGKGRRK